MKSRILRCYYLNERLERAIPAEGVSMQNSHPLQAMQNDFFFCLNSLIAHMHSTLSKAIVCVTGVIDF